MPNKYCEVVCIATLVLTSMAAHAESSGFKQLLIEAINANGQSVTAVASGNLASFFQSQTHSTQPVSVEAVMIKRYATQGCGRVRLSFFQDAKVGPMNSMKVPIEVNYCIDGSFPKDLTERPITGGSKR